MELSSSLGNVGLISEKDFKDFKKKVCKSDSEREQSGQLMAPKSPNAMTVSASPEKDSNLKTVSVTERVKEVSAAILSSTELHVDAPEFKPKIRSQSASMPSDVPNNQNTPNKRAVGSPSKSRAHKNVPRFFPAIVKEDIQNKVRVFFFQIFFYYTKMLKTRVNNTCGKAIINYTHCFFSLLASKIPQIEI